MFVPADLITRFPNPKRDGGFGDTGALCNSIITESGLVQSQDPGFALLDLLLSHAVPLLGSPTSTLERLPPARLVSPLFGRGGIRGQEGGQHYPVRELAQVFKLLYSRHSVGALH